MQQGQKQYGLIKLSKNSTKNSSSGSLAKKPSIFGESDSDSDSESAAIPQFQSSNRRKLAQAKISKAIEEDPAIFQYDEVYDQMKNDDASKLKQNTKTVDKQSRYIGNMLKKKDLREKEQELRSERKIQKERELEGEEFKDKEAFLTSAYKEKLEELKKARESLEQQENIENRLDVTKQDDLTNSYYLRMFRNNLLNPEATSVPIESNQEVKFNKKSSNQKKQNLRERNASEDENEEENEEATENIAITEEVESEPSGNLENTNDKDGTGSRATAEEAQVTDTPQPEANKASNDKQGDATETLESSSNERKEPEPDVLPAKKPKIDRAELIRKIFMKRTVDKAFEEAKNRYMERKALRQL